MQTRKAIPFCQRAILSILWHLDRGKEEGNDLLR